MGLADGMAWEKEFGKENDVVYTKTSFTDLIDLLQAVKKGEVYITSKGSNHRLLQYTGDAVSDGTIKYPPSLLMETHGLLSRKIENPWWEKYIGSAVMVRDSDEDKWHIDIFKKKNGKRSVPYGCELLIGNKCDHSPKLKKMQLLRRGSHK